jgi:hypothetical protein
VGLVVCAAAAAVLVSPDGRVQTDDRNGDGRADRWREYDRAGRLVRTRVDSNFDGRSDVQEYFDAQGALVRRESDRNFNGQVDLVEEFDPITHDRARSVFDVDDDGRADLLVLFRDGQPVYSKYTDPPVVDIGARTEVLTNHAEPIRSDRLDSLAPLDDPFRTDTTVRGAGATSDPRVSVGLSTSGGLPHPRAALAGFGPSSRRFVAIGLTPVSSLDLNSRSPRGPPLS